MKKEHCLFAILVGIAAFSCTSVETQISEGVNEDAMLFTKSSSPSTNVVEQSDFVVTEADIRSFVRRQKDSPRIQSIDPVMRDGDALLYVVNFADGWAIYSADKHLPPVLAKGNTGDFQLDGLDNPGVLQWMENMMDVTRKVRQETTAESANENTDVWDGYAKKKKETDTPERTEYLWTKVLVSSLHQDIDTLDRGPFLQTKWGQGQPWNMRLMAEDTSCYYPCGCAAVAVSQLLYYFHHAIGVPSGLYHGVTVSEWTPVLGYNNEWYFSSQLSRINYTNPSSRWALMIQRGTDYNAADTSSVTRAGYVADLMADVGNRMNMLYSPMKSGADIDDAQAGLLSFGLASEKHNYNDSLALSEILVHNRPFFMGGVKNNNDAHAWVVDGLYQCRVKTTNIFVWYRGYLPGVSPLGEPKTQEEAIEAALEAGYDRPEDLMVTYEYSYSGLYRQYRVNWGFDGDLDNQYIMSFNTIEYNNNQEILYNIHNNAN